MKRLTILSSAAAAVLAVSGTAFGQVQENYDDTDQVYQETDEAEEPVHSWQRDEQADIDTEDTDRFDDPGLDPDTRPYDERRKDASTDADRYEQPQTGTADPDRIDRKDEYPGQDDRDTMRDTGRDDMDDRRFDSSLQQAFNAIDTDGDGMVSRREWADWQADDASYAARFDEFDRDGDRTLSLEEYRESASRKYDTSDLPD